MSGVRQHYLPQFLLKGFASKIKRKEVYTLVFTETNLPFQTNIRNIGIEKEFYSDPSKPYLDDKITLIESKLSNYVNELREIRIDNKLDSSEPSKLINHIFARVKNVRGALINALDFIFRILIENLPNSETLQDSLLNYFKKNPEVILGRLKNKFGTIGKSQRNFILNKRVPILLEKNKDVILLVLLQLLKTLKGNMSNIISESHLKALSENIIPEKRISEIKHFKWTLIVRDPGSFILGDVGPIARIPKSDSYCSLLIGAKEFDLVLIPISNSHLIIGSEYKHDEEININLINNSISACSIEYFISSFNTNRERMYLSNLGKESTVLPESELKKLAEKFLITLLDKS